MHADGRRGERVVWREHEGAPILAALVWCARGAGKDVVPLEYVVLGRMGDNVWRRVLRYRLVLAGQAFGCLRRRHRDNRKEKESQVDGNVNDRGFRCVRDKAGGSAAKTKSGRRV